MKKAQPQLFLHTLLILSIIPFILLVPIFHFNSIEDIVRCPNEGKGYNFGILGTIENAENYTYNILDIKVENLEVIVGSQTKTASCNIKNRNNYYYLDCYMDDLNIIYTEVSIKLSSNVDRVQGITIDGLPNSDRSRTITDSATCKTITNYVKATYFNKGSECGKNPTNLNTYQFKFIVDFELEPAFSNLNSGILKKQSFYLPLNSQNFHVECTFDNNYITLAKQIICVVSGITEDNKFTNSLNIDDTSNIQIEIEDGSKVIGLKEFTGNKVLGIQCPSNDQPAQTTTPPIIPPVPTPKPNNTNTNNTNDTNSNNTNNTNSNETNSNNTNTNNTQPTKTPVPTEPSFIPGVDINCKTHDPTTKKCITCYKNYFLDEKNSCNTCSNLNTGCSTCSPTDYKVCLTCASNYKLNEDECEAEVTCPKDKYGENCQDCSELNSNCDTCNESGFCKKCQTGYFLKGQDASAECQKCLPNCLTCEREDKCLSCKEGYILENNKCVPCFQKVIGCKTCSSATKCTSCFDMNQKYSLINGQCEIYNSYLNEQPSLNFLRFDSYDRINDKVFLKAHFYLADSTLVGSSFNFETNYESYTNSLYPNSPNIFRKLQDSQKAVFYCEQYGISSGNDLSNEISKTSYLANYLCSTSINEDATINNLNANIKDLTIFDPYYRQISSSQPGSTLDLSQLSDTPLEEEVGNSNVYIYAADKIEDLSYDCKNDNNLKFTVSGNLNKNINSEVNFEGNLYDDGDQKIKCVISAPNVNESDSNNSVTKLICEGDGSNYYQKKALIKDGIYTLNQNEKLIIYNKKGINDLETYCNDEIIGGKKKSSSGFSKAAVAGIIIGVIVLLLIGAVVAFFVWKRKSLDSDENYEKDSNVSANDSNKSQETHDAADGEVVNV